MDTCARYAKVAAWLVSFVAIGCAPAASGEELDSSEAAVGAKEAAEDGVEPPEEASATWTVVFGCGTYHHRSPQMWLSPQKPPRDFFVADRHRTPLTTEDRALFEADVSEGVFVESGGAIDRAGTRGWRFPVQDVSGANASLVGKVGTLGVALQRRFCAEGQQIGSVQIFEEDYTVEPLELLSEIQGNDQRHERTPAPLAE